MIIPKLSIIVPVYNVEHYLDACLDSIIQQDYQDFELILIDDGSSDNCPTMCDQIAGRDSRVRVFHQQNSGQATARNVGLAKALGKYVAFVDSDDLLAKGAISMVMKEIEKTRADIVLGCMSRFDNQGNMRPYTRFKERNLMTGKEALRLILEGRIMNISVCGGVFKRSLYDGVTFPDGFICEDWYVTPSLYINTSIVECIPEMYYYYRNNADSTMGGLYKKPNPQILEVAEHVIDIIRLSNDRELYMDTLWSNLRRVWNYIGRLYNSGHFDSEKEFVDKVRNMLQSYWKELRQSKKMSRKELVGVWAFCHCNPLFQLLRRLKN